MKTMLFNPFTGKPRDPRDIASDPSGILMLDPDEPLIAAKPPEQGRAADVATVEKVVKKINAFGDQQGVSSSEIIDWLCSDGLEAISEHWYTSPPSASPVAVPDTAAMYKALEFARVALLPIPSGAGLKALSLIYEILNAQPALPAAGLDSQELARAFDDGWRFCTKWAKRDDLLADMDSNPYTEGRAVCLAAIDTGKGKS